MNKEEKENFYNFVALFCQILLLFYLCEVGNLSRWWILLYPAIAIVSPLYKNWVDSQPIKWKENNDYEQTWLKDYHQNQDDN